MTSRLPLSVVERQCTATRNTARRLPASWWEPGVAEAMAQWIERQPAVPTGARTNNTRRSTT